MATAAEASAGGHSSNDGSRGTLRPAADANWRPEMTCAFLGPDQRTYNLRYCTVLGTSLVPIAMRRCFLLFVGSTKLFRTSDHKLFIILSVLNNFVNVNSTSNYSVLV